MVGRNWECTLIHLIPFYNGLIYLFVGISCSCPEACLLADRQAGLKFWWLNLYFNIFLDYVSFFVF